jgi:DNA-binding MarR family transcriptional regulator
MGTKVQKAKFRSIEERSILNVLRTAEHLASALSEVFKGAELTLTQYNVLRILRGAGNEALSCSEISERMITKESDITRLLDRLEARGFISRERPESNRRLVLTRLTDTGLAVLAALDSPVDAINRKLIGPLGAKKLESLNELLEEARSIG